MIVLSGQQPADSFIGFPLTLKGLVTPGIVRRVGVVVRRGRVDPVFADPPGVLAILEEETRRIAERTVVRQRVRERWCPCVGEFSGVRENAFRFLTVGLSG